MDKALEDLVRRRANNRCEYCLFPLPPFHIEHIIARQHGGQTTDGNLALACARCNRHKGPNLAGIDRDSGALIALFNPRQDRWVEHFREKGPRIEGTTAIGRVTVTVLDMNHPLRVGARRELIVAGVLKLS
jgi:hypothetical protein